MRRSNPFPGVQKPRKTTAKWASILDEIDRCKACGGTGQLDNPSPHQPTRKCEFCDGKGVRR